MFRKIFLINVGLFVILLLLSYNFYTIWSQVLTQIKSPPVQIELPKKSEPFIEDEDVIENPACSGIGPPNLWNANPQEVWRVKARPPPKPMFGSYLPYSTASHGGALREMVSHHFMCCMYH